MNNFYRLSLVFLFALKSHIGFTQTDTIIKKRMVYGLGYSYLRFLDKQNSPLIYRGHLLSLNFGYEKVKPNKSIFIFNLNTVIGVTNSKHGWRKTWNYYDDKNGDPQEEYITLIYPLYQIDINTGYLYKVKTIFNDKTNIYIGGKIHEFFFINYLATWGIAMPAIFNELTLNPSFLIDFKLKQNTRISSSFSFPVFGLITRMPYSNDPITENLGPFEGLFLKETGFTAINEYQRFDFELKYEKEINEKTNLRLSYRFYWFQYPEHWPLHSYNNLLEIQFARKLNYKK